MKDPNILEELAGHNVTKLDNREGDSRQLGDLRLTFKAKGEQTGFQFSVFEMTLASDAGIPLHKHPYPEFFYVLDGKVDFSRLSDEGAVEWMSCGGGASVMAPPNAPHTFHNHSDQPAKFLSVSTHHHEVMLGGGTPTSIDAPPVTPNPEDFERFFKALEQNQVYVVEA